MAKETPLLGICGKLPRTSGSNGSQVWQLPFVKIPVEINVSAGQKAGFPVSKGC